MYASRCGRCASLRATSAAASLSYGTEITDISRTPGSREPKSPSTITAWAFGTPMLLPTLPVLTM